MTLWLARFPLLNAFQLLPLLVEIHPTLNDVIDKLADFVHSHIFEDTEEISFFFEYFVENLFNKRFDLFRVGNLSRDVFQTGTSDASHFIFLQIGRNDIVCEELVKYVLCQNTLGHCKSAI